MTHAKKNPDEPTGYSYPVGWMNHPDGVLRPGQFRDTFLAACGKRVDIGTLSGTPTCKKCKAAVLAQLAKMRPS
jgi:hypothetical protein